MTTEWIHLIGITLYTGHSLSQFTSISGSPNTVADARGLRSKIKIVPVQFSCPKILTFLLLKLIRQSRVR